MVILVQKLGRSLKLGHRLENPESQEALRASLQAFRCHISQTLVKILGDGPDGSGHLLSLAWIQRCLDKLLMIEKAFAKLVVDIDYPMARWGASVSEAYLNYTLNVLELLNKMASSLSHLSQARLSLSYRLSLDANSSSTHLPRIQPRDLGNSFNLNKTGRTNSASPRESIVHEALAVMISAGLQLFGVMLSGLCGSSKPYFEVTKSAGDQITALPSLQWRLEYLLEIKRSALKEVEEVNDAADQLVDPRKGDAAEILVRKLEILDKVLQAVGKQAEGVFSQVLAARTKFLDTIRHK